MAAIVGTIKLSACLEPTAELQNFLMSTGEAKNLAYTLTDGYQNAVDLTGATIKWILEPDPTSATASVSKSTAAGITITNATAGEFTVALSSTDTSALTPETYFHACSVTDATGDKTLVATGYATLSALPANV